MAPGIDMRSVLLSKLYLDYSAYIGLVCGLH